MTRMWKCAASAIAAAAIAIGAGSPAARAQAPHMRALEMPAFADPAYAKLTDQSIEKFIRATAEFEALSKQDPHANRHEDMSRRLANPAAAEQALREFDSDPMAGKVRADTGLNARDFFTIMFALVFAQAQSETPQIAIKGISADVQKANVEVFKRHEKELAAHNGDNSDSGDSSDSGSGN
jgi:hypothetical protein